MLLIGGSDAGAACDTYNACERDKCQACQGRTPVLLWSVYSFLARRRLCDAPRAFEAANKSLVCGSSGHAARQAQRRRAPPLPTLPWRSLGLSQIDGADLRPPSIELCRALLWTRPRSPSSSIFSPLPRQCPQFFYLCCYLLRKNDVTDAELGHFGGRRQFARHPACRRRAWRRARRPRRGGQRQRALSRTHLFR